VRTALKPEVIVEAATTCRQCGAIRRHPVYLVVRLQPADTWRGLGELLFVSCGECGQRGAAHPAVLRAEDETGGFPGFLLLPVTGQPTPADLGQGHQFLAEHGILPMRVPGLVPTGWPAISAEPTSSVLSVLEGDPRIAPQIARYGHRNRAISDLMEIGSVTSPQQLRAALTSHPELVADAADSGRDLPSILDFPPEAGRLAEAFAALFMVLNPAVTDTELAIAYEHFERERGAAMAKLTEAASGKVRWLTEHPGAPPEDWDPVAVEALHLLGLAGQAPMRARLLDFCGNTVVNRPGATPAQVSWALSCLRESRGLWRALGDSNQEARVGINLGMALYAWDYADVYATNDEAETVMREVVAHYEVTAEAETLALALTDLAIILLKAATIDQRQERIQEAVDLCRRALTLGQKAKNPLGWAFSAANLALALVRLGASGGTAQRSQLEQAAATGHEAARILREHGDLPAARQARINRLDALVGLAGHLRNERLRPLVGVDQGSERSRALVAQVLDTNPAAYGLTETPPEIAEIVRGPAAPDEARILTEVVDEAAALITEPWAARSPAMRSRLARMTAVAVSKLLGTTQAAAVAVAAARSLIDKTVAPDAAAETANLLGAILARLNQWEQAAAAFNDCLGVYEEQLQQSADRDRVLQILGRAPWIARWTAYSQVQAGQLEAAVTTLERTRSRSFAHFVPGSGRNLELLSWRSATLQDIGQAATPDCPVAYVLAAPSGSVVLLVRRSGQGSVGITAYQNSLSAGFLIATMFSMVQPERGLLSAPRIDADMAPAIEPLMKPLGSLLGPVVADLLADGIRDLILIPTGPAALLPWAAATIQESESSPPTFVGELLTLSIAPSAAAVVLSRQRAAGRAGDAAAGSILVVANPERADASNLPGALDEANWIKSSFPGRVDVLAGSAATIDEVLGRLPDCWVAHLACHGTSDVFDPQATRLLLSDGDLTLERLLQLPELRARLVVLSACQSGHVEIRDISDEMLGMPLALLQAGAGTVVSTLWPIDDRVAAMLVGRLYEELADEFSADGCGDLAAALARAQRWLRSLTREEARRWRQQRGVREMAGQRRSVKAAVPSPRAADTPYASPHFWAGFVAYGR
jgi:CHAT domain-containing protein/tetratricopeptide (TPR) repeat protein